MTIAEEDRKEEVKLEIQDEEGQEKYPPSIATVTPPPLTTINQSTDNLLITPLNISNLPASILQHLQQQNLGNVITSFATTHEDNHHSDESTPTLIPSTTAANLLDSSKANNKNLTADERRQRRLWRNRVAAKECRKKKKLYVHELKETISRLEGENSALRKQVDDIKMKLAKRDQEQQPSPMENFKLMKQVEELNAKLGNI
ncbi:hypothetical protein [Parasitella parasitica]|uniref:BZIP domain-containing protein n=1 Tax=Parasitella parasitica TaxID=35722 RepID=A0A0B7NVV9_9FUNG|nr:hypothetical protein [Parasitella parasitica]